MAHELKTIAQSIVANGKGLLAADESTGTFATRFDSVRCRVHRGKPPCLPRPALHPPRASSDTSSA